MARRMSLLLIVLALALAAAGYGALHYMTAVPGKPHRGPLPPGTLVTLGAAAPVGPRRCNAGERRISSAVGSSKAQAARPIDSWAKRQS